MGAKWLEKNITFISQKHSVLFQFLTKADQKIQSAKAKKTIIADATSPTALNSHQVNSAFHFSGIDKSSTSLSGGG